MSKFPLKETSVSVRDHQIRVRELTQGERTRVAQAAAKDSFSVPALILSLAAVEPRWTEAEAAEESAEVVSVAVKEIMSLSGMGGGDDSKND